MDNFDYSQYYYRPVHIRSGYASYDDDIINNAKGYIEADSAMIEFSSLEDVCSWLYLGDEIKVITIPEDAQVVPNKPMSQGGCYQYSTNKAIVIETIGVLDFLNRANKEKISVVHVKKLDFPAGFELPQQVSFFIFDQCSFKHSPSFGKNLNILKLWDCNVSGKFALPKSIDELEINDETIMPFNSNTDFIFPQVVKGEMMLSFIEIKTPLDMSLYTCQYIRFSYCHFKQTITLPKMLKEDILYETGYSSKEKHVRNSVVIFEDCYGIDKNLVIPEDFIGNADFIISNTTINNDIINQLKNKYNCRVNIRK